LFTNLTIICHSLSQIKTETSFFEGERERGDHAKNRTESRSDEIFLIGLFFPIPN